MSRPILISIRNASSRLPGKCLVDIAGRSSVHRQVEHLQLSREASVVAIATSHEAVDDDLEAAARDLGIPCVRGAVDKLPRYVEAAAELDAEFVVTVDGDDVLADPAQVDRIFRAYDESVAAGEPIDYARVEELPVGATGHGLRIAAARRVLELRNEASQDFWTLYFTESDRFRVRLLGPEPAELRRTDIRLTLDYQEDLEVFTRVFEHFGERPFLLPDVVAFLDAHPEIAALNRDAQRRYEENLAAKITPVELREAD